jgi:D-3-phosphoglycerate dehydrogenase
MNRTESNRVVVLHQNIPNIITQISAALAKDNVNIESLFSQAKGNNAVSFFDTNDAINQVVIDDITAIAGVAKVRAL